MLGVAKFFNPSNLYFKKERAANQHIFIGLIRIIDLGVFGPVTGRRCGLTLSGRDCILISLSRLRGTTMKPEILLGDEAVALGAIHAGLSAGYSYPGTPASEIMEYLIKAAAKSKSFLASWSVNEKVAYEEALGVSFAGKRALVSMKHVGLNVAADPFMNSALTGANGGLVVVPADDPGMHSSQNEQDSRFYADFAKIPCFEPSNHQEAYEMTRQAFDISEKLGVPVMIRLVTRLSHSRSTVRPREARRQNELQHGASQDWTLLPVNARRRFRIILDSQAAMVLVSEESAFNSLRIESKNQSLGIIASGIAFNYVQENLAGLENPPSLLKLCTYPLPEKLVRRLVEHVETVLIVEEGYPLIERSLRGLFGVPGKTIKGKLSRWRGLISAGSSWPRDRPNSVPDVLMPIPSTPSTRRLWDMTRGTSSATSAATRWVLILPTGPSRLVFAWGRRSAWPRAEPRWESVPPSR
jgi:TPP-dependent indolepyruvate ferredoxin oxidoreductase alpha subunit